MNMFGTSTFEQRCVLSNNIRTRYPDIVPVILQTTKNEQHISLVKNKFLVPESVTVRKFMVTAQGYTNVPESMAVFLTVNGVAPNMESDMGSIYKKYKNSDGFLYIHISSENCFGGYTPSSSSSQMVGGIAICKSTLIVIGN